MGGFLFSVALSVCSQNPWNWNDRKGKDYLTISLWVSQNRLSYIIRFFLGTTWAGNPKNGFLRSRFFFVSPSANHGLPHAFQQGLRFRISRSFQGSTASCVAASKMLRLGGIFGGKNSLFLIQKEEKNNATNLLTFFFADRFGLISLFFVGDWIFVDLSICQSHMFHIKILIFNVTVMTLYQKH